MSALEEQIAARKRLRAIFYPPAKPKTVARPRPVQDQLHKPESIAERLSASVRFIGTLETTVSFGIRQPAAGNHVLRAHPVTIREIHRAVAGHFGISLIDILSERRTASVVRPRQVAMYLAKCLTTRSLAEIGRHTGGRDHTTALHAVRKIEALVSTDSGLAADIAAIKKSLGVME